MISTFLDPYDRKARLYPALLVMLVPVAVLTLVSPVTSNQLAGLASLAVALGGLMLVSSLGREWGKRKETDLFQKWGGTPTTLMLLRATSSLDYLTLDRYRSVLEGKIPGLIFLNAADEESQSQKAVAICESAVKWLREATRDSKKFALIFTENTNYGFRRNLLGVRPLAIAICFLTLFSTALNAWLGSSGNLAAISSESWASVALTCAGMLIWCCLVTTEFVKTTAFAYATALLAACDSPHIASLNAKARKSTAAEMN